MLDDTVEEPVLMIINKKIGLEQKLCIVSFWADCRTAIIYFIFLGLVVEKVYRGSFQIKF